MTRSAVLALRPGPATFLLRMREALGEDQRERRREGRQGCTCFNPGPRYRKRPGNRAFFIG